MSCYYHSQLLIPYLAQIMGFWVTCLVKQCHYVMVEAESNLQLLPTSILDIYKVFDHIKMPSMGIQYQPYTVNLEEPVRVRPAQPGLTWRNPSGWPA
jgi:hypothetical protein